jgi:nucleotide-binding universal stress UspA family protein
MQRGHSMYLTIRWSALRLSEMGMGSPDNRRKADDSYQAPWPARVGNCDPPGPLEGRETLMTTKILAVLAEATTASACLDAAEAAAHALGDATIEALHVITDPDHMVGASEEIAIQALRERTEGSAQSRATATHAAFDAWVKSHPLADIPLRWKERVGAEEENVEKEAGTVNVLVLARSTNLDGFDALHAAFYYIKHPFFLVPSTWKLLPGESFAEHIVIAWNGTDGCRMAVEGSLPWLRLAKDVTILLIDEQKKVAATLEYLLKDEKITYRVHGAARGNESLGDQILHEAHKLGADLLVMGAYRHNEFVEWLLGRTTRQALAHMDMPLFMAH